MVNGLRSRSFVSVTHKKENLADVDAVIYPRPGVDMKLNWSLNRDDVTPLNEVVCPRLFNNGAVICFRHVHFRSSVMRDVLMSSRFAAPADKAATVAERWEG